MPHKDKEIAKEYHRKYQLDWYRAHKEEIHRKLKEKRKSDPEYYQRRLAVERASHQKHKVKRNVYNREYAKGHLPERAVSAKRSRVKAKREVLSHYGRNGIAQCCWNGCDVADIDVLTVDHIYNDGAQKRRDGTHARGFYFYIQLRMNGFPEGFQTLCANHQLKKEILRKRRSDVVTAGLKVA